MTDRKIEFFVTTIATNNPIHGTYRAHTYYGALKEFMLSNSIHTSKEVSISEADGHEYVYHCVTRDDNNDVNYGSVSGPYQDGEACQ